MHTITFKKDEEFSNDLFEFVFEGFIIHGNIVPEGRNMKVWKREERILDKFAAISHECKKNTKFYKDEVKRYLNDGETKLELDTEEFEMIVSRVQQVPWGCGMNTTYRLNRVLKYLMDQ